MRPCLLVFAAGRGTRMRPLTDHLPKAMLPILDVPLIDLVLSRGGSVDWAERFVNLSGPLPQLREHLTQNHCDVTTLQEGPGPIGQAATLQRLLPQLAQTILTYNCDLVADLDPAMLLARHAEGKKSATLAVQRVASGADFTGQDGALRLVDRRRENAPGFVFLGAACFDRNLLDTRLDGSSPAGLTEALLRPVIDTGDVVLVEHAGYARDAGTPASYLAVNLDALHPERLRIDTPGTISPQGWYLGPGSSTGTAPGKGAVLLAGSRIEKGAKVTDCVVWPGCTVPSGARASGGIWFLDRFLGV
ncbi:MAG: NDP-sugar synthase [Actinomycetota bacterium]